jgi:hypothetical protein
MQLECANAFIAPIKDGLINEKNMVKLFKCTVSILEYELNQPDSNLLEPFEKIFKALCSKLSIHTVKEVGIPFLLELNKM